MSQNGNGQSHGNAYPKGLLEISGIPLKSECDRIKKELEKHGPDIFGEKVEIRFIETSHPDRRVYLKIDKTSPSLVTWLTEALRMSLMNCSYPKFEISAVLLRQ